MQTQRRKMIKEIAVFCKKELVLCIAAVLALGSMLAVPPDTGYASYIDWKVLGILFSLMVVMEGLRQLGVFNKIAYVMLKKADNLRKLSFIMVGLCFVSAMFITNDVALITFVPFTLLLLSLSGMQEHAVRLVVYETIAANMGSMLTPVGNPQNLYLYTVFEMDVVGFFKLTAPIAGAAAILLTICCLRIKSHPVALAAAKEQEGAKETDGKDRVIACFYCMVFLLSLLAVVRLLPVFIPVAVALAGTLLLHRKVLCRVDYCLLLTFISFFVFIGNVGRIQVVSDWLRSVLSGRELLVAYLSSQVISNMPAAVLLAGFTDDCRALLLGVDIGGLGTLIASLASLISYKCFAQELPEKKAKYFWYFTLVNVIFAVILMSFAAILTV